MIHTTWLYVAVPVTPHGEAVEIFSDSVAPEGDEIKVRSNMIAVKPHVNLRSAMVHSYVARADTERRMVIRAGGVKIADNDRIRASAASARRTHDRRDRSSPPN